jgi:hypothetical protein
MHAKKQPTKNSSTAADLSGTRCKNYKSQIFDSDSEIRSIKIQPGANLKNTDILTII